MEVTTLLADPIAIRLEQITSATNLVTLVVRAVQPCAECPRCRRASARIHSRYVRRVADLPWHGVAVRLELHTRRFRCLDALCTQRVFCERLPQVVARYARQTARLNNALELIGFAIGGRAGARAALQLGMITSPETLIRRIRQAVLPPSPTPHVLGVDDFAMRRGQSYGTILVDLERRRPVDLLPDREAKTLAEWLKARPGVETISRDRALAYADAAKQGAPSAVQVADRWHLLRNMSEALERWLGCKRRHLRQAAEMVRIATASVPPPVEATASPATVRQRQQSRRDERCAERLDRFTEVKELYRQGATIRGIAQKFKMHRRDVRQFIHADECPHRAQAQKRGSKLNKYLPYLRERWEQGCHNATELAREITGQGFNGADSLVRRLITSWRAHLPAHLRCVRRLQSGAPPPPQVVAPSPRTAAWLLLRKDEELKDEQRNLLSKLFEVCPETQTAQRLVQRFQQIVTGRRADEFDAWLADVAESKLPELESFAGTLGKDAAVRAALSSKWSNGQTEGQVNRLKMIKRMMYGRANLDLLRARVLHAV